MFSVNPTTASREIGSQGDNMVVIFRHPNAKSKESRVQTFAQVLTWTTYQKRSTNAPRYLDCITAVAYVAKRAFQAHTFPEDRKIPIKWIRELPPHMIRAGWEPLLIPSNEVESGDVLLVAKKGLHIVTHTAMFISKNRLVHASKEQQKGVICSLKELSAHYNIQLTLRQILDYSPASGNSEESTLGRKR